MDRPSFKERNQAIKETFLSRPARGYGGLGYDYYLRYCEGTIMNEAAMYRQRYPYDSRIRDIELNFLSKRLCDILGITKDLI